MKIKFILLLMISINLLKKSEAQTAIMLKDIFERRNGSAPCGFIKIEDKIYFSANNGTNGAELWKSDGTQETTVLVKDIFPINDNGSSPGFLTSVNNTLYFSANNGINGCELWKSNGDASGTVMVKNIFPFDKLFKTDYSSDPQNLTNVNGKLFFSADNGTNGRELWKSDGTSVGTVLIIDIFAGKQDSKPENLININGTLFFTADNGINGRELWKSDGTTIGTLMVKDINAGRTSSNPNMLTNVNGVLFFVVSNDSGNEELWKSDGTVQGTIFLKEFTNSNTTIRDLMSQNKFVVMNNSIYFIKDNIAKGALELWKSTGTSEGTTCRGSLGSSSHIGEVRDLLECNNSLYFIFEDNKIMKCDKNGLSKTDITDNASDNGLGARIYDLTNINGTLFFTKSISTGSVTKYSLYQSKGTLAETELIMSDVKNPVREDLFFELNKKVYFVADDKTHGDEIWYIENK